MIRLFPATPVGKLVSTFSVLVPAGISNRLPGPVVLGVGTVAEVTPNRFLAESTTIAVGREPFVPSNIAIGVSDPVPLSNVRLSRISKVTRSGQRTQRRGIAPPASEGFPRPPSET